MIYNTKTQYYKNIPLKLIKYTDAHFARLKAKRFMLGNPKYNQNIWIPNVFLEQDGTLKSDINIDFIFRKAYQQKKFDYAHIQHLYKNIYTTFQ